MKKKMTYQLSKITQTVLLQCGRKLSFSSHLSSIFSNYLDWKGLPYFHSNIIWGKRAVPIDLIEFYNPPWGNGHATLLNDELKHYINTLRLVESEKNKLYSALLGFAEKTFFMEDLEEILKGLPAEASVDALATLWARLVWMVVIFDHKPQEMQAQLLRKEASPN